jgi:glutamate/tyrosine decarboxylase-like PLP-dependent enzyme
MAAGDVDTDSIRAILRSVEVRSRQLDPCPEQRHELWRAVGEHVLGNLADLGEKAAYPHEALPDPSDLAISESPAPVADALRGIAAVERPGLNQASGSHFAYIPGGGLFPSALGDLLADVSNCYAGVHVEGPGASLMERSLVRWMADLVGYPATAGGDLTSGASIANLEAIVTARDAAGVRSADVGRSVVYMTSQTHHCIEKALRVAGLAECVVRRVDLDDGWRMSPHALEAAVEADRAAGLFPWLVVATAGTTDTGAVDRLGPLADIAEAHDLWLHVDAAYGGFFVLTDHGRCLLAGIERSRSVVMDPHKGLFLPYGSGALIVCDERQLAESHRYSANYLRDVQEMGGVFSSSDLSVELSRPFRGPRLWLPLKLFGLAVFRAALDEKLLLARYFHARLAQSPGWIVGPAPDLSVVTYRYAPRSGNADDFNRRLLQAVSADGRAAISATEIKGAYTLRLAVLHYRSHLEEIDALLNILDREAKRLEDA